MHNKDNQILEKNLSSPFSDELSKRFLQYALSTITSRSLPDVRDGLKPVHRRLLYAMRLLKLSPDKGFKKSARVVGDVMGKFHPHGDAAIYDAMVRLAQDFSMNYKLVEGQGNFGNIDGDNAAAMRYTEARLSEVSSFMLEGIEEDAIDFRPTYDGDSQEPILLPSGFPNLLANGAQGIAVGMATSIPPHNLLEICDASLLLIDNKSATTSDLCNIVKGPDFPTGGTIIENTKSIKETYELGKGSFRLRANWCSEKKPGGTWQICIYEIPFQVQKSRIIEKIANLLNDKKLIMISDVRDESSDEIRIIIEPKSRNLNPKEVMESLYRQTELETRVSLNLNVLDENGVPRVMPLKEAIISWLNHRRTVLERVSRYSLKKINNRLEVLESYLIVFLNVDLVIKIIREDDDPKKELIKRFSLSENQANSILDMRLRNLRQLEEKEIIKEKKLLIEKKKNLENLLNNKSKQWKEIKKQINNLKYTFENQMIRNTLIDNEEELSNLPIILDIEKELVSVIISEKGWVKTIKGHQVELENIKFKDGDKLNLIIYADTLDQLTLFANNGKFYTLSIYKLPSGRGYGEPLSIILDDFSEGNIIYATTLLNQKFLLASSSGHGFIVDGSNVISTRKSGRQVLSLKNDHNAVACVPLIGDMVAIVGTNRKVLIFPANEVPELTKGKGVYLQRYRDGQCSDVTIFNSDDGLTWKQSKGRKRTEKNIINWIGKRGGVGRMPPVGFPNPPNFT